MRNYLPVNNIRFMAMIGIVAIHCGILAAPKGYLNQDIIEIIITQFFKYGTLCFFMISGFLLGDKLEQYNPVIFFKRRLQAVGFPWLVWSTIFFAIIVFADFIKYRHYNILVRLKEVIFHSEYWFVPNFILALGILIIFRYQLNSLWMGCVLSFISLFYGLNIYWHIFPIEHTTALLGFIFYLWLGYQFRVRNLSFIRWLADLSTPTIALLVIITYIVGCIESLYR